MLEDNGSGNGGQLDKFYDVVQLYVENGEHGVGKGVNYEKMTGKPHLPKK